MRIRTTDCCLIQKGSGIVMTQEQSNQNECQILIYSVQDFLARLIPNKIRIPKPSRESLQRKDFCIKTSG